MENETKQKMKLLGGEIMLIFMQQKDYRPNFGRSDNSSK